MSNILKFMNSIDDNTNILINLEFHNVLYHFFYGQHLRKEFLKINREELKKLEDLEKIKETAKIVYNDKTYKDYSIILENIFQ